MSVNLTNLENSKCENTCGVKILEHSLSSRKNAEGSNNAAALMYSSLLFFCVVLCLLFLVVFLSSAWRAH